MYPQFYCEDYPSKEIAYHNYAKSESDLFRIKFLNKIGQEKVKEIL
jgi:hypothetical protein